MEFANKEDVTKRLQNLYQYFHGENINHPGFSERAFAKKIGVSASYLNNIRNGIKKEIELNNAIKLLKGMGKEEYITPVIKALLPESKKIFFKDSLYNNDKVPFAEKKEMDDIVHAILSKSYGRIMLIVLTGMEDTDTKVEHIRSISVDADILLRNLVITGMLEITPKGIVRFPERIRKMIDDKKIQLLLNHTLKVSENFHDYFNPSLVENDQDIGYHDIFTGLYYEEDIPKFIEYHEELRRKVEALEKRKRGGDIKMGSSALAVSLFNPYKNFNLKKEEIKNSENHKIEEINDLNDNKETLQ